MGVLETASGASIATFCNDSLQILWPDAIKYDKVLLIVTDAAAYMLCGISSLKMMYPKMLHLTCFAHILYRVADFIRLEFEHVNKLISCTKSVFLKAPRRKQLFRKMCPNLALPPIPCHTRWGTWLEAAIYFAEHLEEVKAVVSTLNNEDSESILQAKRVFKMLELNAQLAFIKYRYCFKKVTNYWIIHT